MNSFKILVLTFTALFLFTGCYTQLKHTHQMTKITEKSPVNGYSQNDEANEEVTEANNSRAAGVSEEELVAYTEEYDVPIYYKNYNLANWWDSCACSPYAYDYGYYDRFYFGSSFYFGSPYYYSRYHYYSDPYLRWKLRHHSWAHFGSSFTMSWRWGYHYPYHYYRYYDPFLYNYYGHPVAFNNYYFYGRNYGYTNNRNVRSDSRRYGPRGVGTNRTVTSDSNRARERQSVTSSGNRAASTSTPRTIGTSRTRDNNATVTRTRNDSNSASTTRSRGTVQRTRDTSSSSGTSVTRTRSRSGDNSSESVGGDQNRRRTISLPRYVNTTSRSNEEVRQRIRSSKVPASSVNTRNNSRERKTFLNRVGSFINKTTSNISSSTNRVRRSVNIKSSSGSRSSSSVTRSKSSSGNSRSRGNVSRSRSGSSSSSSGTSRSRSGGGSSSSDRSRGNN